MHPLIKRIKCFFCAFTRRDSELRHRLAESHFLSGRFWTTNLALIIATVYTRARMIKVLRLENCRHLRPSVRRRCVRQRSTASVSV